MNFKTIAAASVIALLPVTSFASVDVSIEGTDGVGLDGINLGGTSSSDPVDNVTDSLLFGPEFALDWNMRVINTVPPAGSFDTQGTAEWNFSIAQVANVAVSSTQNPFGGLTGLTLELLRNGTSMGGGPVAYTAGAFAALDGNVRGGDTITVRADWASMDGPFSEVDVDFSIYATDFDGADIPLPASALLLVGALGGLGFVARKRS
ncbi:MAG TPA: VPLPA-CTERM sorting domain-containing protein [Alphaproteobacteria bacterium]|nr:VPLPA-CTERM sorting domain-containing protein [Alphaproteobacteria bacterium]